MNPWLGLRDSLGPIRRAPTGGGREAWIHHGFRAFLVVLIGLSVIWIFPGASISGYERIEPGSVADQDVIAEFAFNVPKSAEQLEEEQQAAILAVPTFVIEDRSGPERALAEVQRFFTQLDSAVSALQLRAVDTELEGERLAEFLRAGVLEFAEGVDNASFSEEQADYLLGPTRRGDLRASLEAAFDEVLTRGAMRTEGLQGPAPENVTIRLRGGEGFGTVVPFDSIPLIDDVLLHANERASTELPAVGADIFRTLMIRYTEPTHVLDLDEIRLARNQALASVSRFGGTVLENERIITQNEPVGQFEYDRLQAYIAAQRENRVGLRTGFWYGLGTVLLAASLLGILVFSTYTFRRDIYEDLRSFSVLLGLIVFVVGIAGIVAATGGPPTLIPIALAGLLAAALFDSLLGVVVVSTIAGILLAQTAFEGLDVPMLSVAGGVTAAFAVGGVRTRSQSWVLIALISAAYVAGSLFLLLTGRFEWGDVGVNSLVGFGNATVCTALAMGAILPVLETFTRRTTEQTLLELADMNRSLLRRLSREAPGTYAHSINLANLAEAACEAIGADTVLARVGVYYHDIGKLERPQYFIENQPKGLNPHDRLDPLQSAEILRDHVRDGLRMAEEARLPEVVRAFIREHHGTQQIKFFLHRAREIGAGEDLDPNDFAYPGPKPQSKETAIAMLGDAVESASRTLTEPTPERVRALIDGLVSARIEEGELDECGLTFRELDQVKQAFARVLTGLYHHRIDYPKPAPDSGSHAIAGETTSPSLPASRTDGEAEDRAPGPRAAEPESEPRRAEPRPGSVPQAQQMSIELGPTAAVEGETVSPRGAPRDAD